MDDFGSMVELTAANLGTRVLAANDEFFAPKERLILPSPPVFIEGKFTDRGKWMDGWETRRRRTPGHDWCILRLGLPGIVHGVIVDTSHFKGNQPEMASIEGLDLGEKAEDGWDAGNWFPVLNASPLRPDAENAFQVPPATRVTHLRLNIFPDGGVARLRVYGEPRVDFRRLCGEIDLAALQTGASIVAASDMNFGHADHLIAPGEPENMGQGWETRRRRGPGHDWCIIELGAAGIISRVEVFTTHFKGNFPESCSLEGIQGVDREIADGHWWEVLPRVALQADSSHAFAQLASSRPVSHVRFNIFPDGGVARLRLWGRATPEGYRTAGLRYLNSLCEEAATDLLRSCCGSSAWARKVVSTRPFSDLEALQHRSRSTFPQLAEQDLLEAFAAHPRIGAGPAATQTRQAAQWSAAEQSSVIGDPAREKKRQAEWIREFEEANERYERLFGFKFIICATGKEPGDILGAMRKRMHNSRQQELALAADEERQITHLRLEKLFQP